MLPISSSGGSLRYLSSGGLVPEYVWRLAHWRQLDFDLAMSQAADLLTQPGEVGKTTRMRKQIKNQWARDDPAFVLLLVGLILSASLAYCVAFGVRNVLHLLRLTVGGVLIEFLLVACAVSSGLRWLVNRRMRVQRLHAVEQSVEWLYAFDVHCNALFASFVLVSSVQYCMLPLLLRESWLATLAANALWTAGAAAYAYITFLGYAALPFVSRPERLVSPLGVALLLAALATLLNLNLARLLLTLYFGHSHAHAHAASDAKEHT